MPVLLKDDMEAINRFFMEGTVVKTREAEKIKQEWIKWWKDNKRDWTWYTQEEYDHARNIRNRFHMANAVTSEQKTEVAAYIASAKLTREELQGETRRAGTTGYYLEEPDPVVPTSWKAAATIGAGLVITGMFAKRILMLHPYGRVVSKILP